MIKRNLFLLVFGVIISLFSCEYEKLEFSDDLPQNVSLTEDVMPIFDRSCNMAGCHPANGIPPDLSPENAHTALTLGGMVDTLNPELSILYVRMIDTKDPMPPSGLLSNYEINVVLGWITEGAKDN